MSKESEDRLESYRRKRHSSRTPEPFGSVTMRAPVGAGGARLFVVQKHAARNLHWDLRLESEGVLLSWAVPKGPSPNPQDKRLAVRVEDHPLDYADFEGVIPEGEYGGGPVIVWDRGVWIPLEDEREGLEKGKLLFELRGYKLRGRWTLVKTRQSEDSWLFIKERDAFVREEGTESYPDASIYSGLTVEEVRDPGGNLRALEERLAEVGARRGGVDARSTSVMLAASAEAPFSRPGWLFEIKYDGYRMLAGREDGGAALVSRSGVEMTRTFPEVARAVRALPYPGLVLDGEVVVHDERGMPSFDRLQRRGLLSRDLEVARAVLELPATYYAFDLLAVGGWDLRGLPLTTRKEILRTILPPVGPVRFSEHVEARGEEMYAQVSALGLEGIVGKRSDAPYRGGRSRDWVKVRALSSDDFVVVGWTEPEGSRAGLGALHLARHDPDGVLRYRGSVGTGFDDATLGALTELLRPLERQDRPFEGALATLRGKPRTHHWVEPVLVCEVRFRERTEQGHLRHPVFLRLRDDKAAAECVDGPEEQGRREGSEQERDPERGPKKGAKRGVRERGGQESRREVPFTNLDKVFFPERGYTKGRLLEYYRSVSEWLLPYLRDRPLVLTRYPDGIHGKSFYQKNAPEWSPDWIRTVSSWSEESEREIEYFVCDDLESLLYLVNLGTIPLHVWSSRVASLAQPDWCILDLDPKDAPFTDVVAIARHIHALCEEIGLPSFPKTSGSTGLHILIPLGRQCTYEQSCALAELLARTVVAELPAVATIVRTPGRRGGRVYLDYLQNRHGQLLVSPFSVRPVPEGAVSTPLRWGEVTRRLTPRAHTLETVPKRMRRLGTDPMAPVLAMTPDLLGALAALQERMGGEGSGKGH